MPELDIRVAIVEDQADVRDGLASLIGEAPGFRCIYKFRTMEDALKGIGLEFPEFPDILLVDIGLPGMSGVEGVRLLREKYSTLEILMLTIYDGDETIFQVMCAGTCGYLLKKTAPEKLLEGLREVARGGAPMSPEVARR